MRRNQELPKILVRSAGVLLLLTSSVVAASDGFINPAGPVAEALRDHLIFIVVVMAIVIAPLFIALPWVLWRYRLGTKSGSYQPNWEFSWPLEVLIWGLPAVIVGVLSWNLWHQSYELDPYKPLAATEAPLEVQAIALDWKWVFIYPEQDVASVNELMIVAGRPVRFRLTSGTVMQSFMIPRLGGQIYTMAGMVTQLNLLASEPGQFRGLNTQYNGMGFANQKFMTHAVSQADFDTWAVNMSESKPPLNQTAWAQLAKPSVLASPQSFGSVAEGLFTGVIADFTGGYHHIKADGTDL
ncbi:MAG TPA: ubiquinol oxidase subunit II [Methyloprofundus sp.]|nr:ubiquinol oxidase subunit II [Methyloprofundus sp.]HIL79434.1 ubiquinol oxidase subunit II [Methylococcales bacterium]